MNWGTKVLNVPAEISNSQLSQICTFFPDGSINAYSFSDCSLVH